MSSSEIQSHFKVALTQLLLIIFYYPQDIKNTVLQYNIGHSQETLNGPSSSLKQRMVLKAGINLLLVALGKLSTCVFALQSFCVLLVQPNGALWSLEIKPL